MNQYKEIIQLLKGIVAKGNQIQKLYHIADTFPELQEVLYQLVLPRLEAEQSELCTQYLRAYNSTMKEPHATTGNK